MECIKNSKIGFSDWEHQAIFPNLSLGVGGDSDPSASSLTMRRHVAVAVACLWLPLLATGFLQPPSLGSFTGASASTSRRRLSGSSSSSGSGAGAGGLADGLLLGRRTGSSSVVVVSAKKNKNKKGASSSGGEQESSGGGGSGGGGGGGEGGDAPQRKKRVRKRVQASGKIKEGEAVEIAEVEALVRKRKVSRLGAGPLDVDQFIADEAMGEAALPDLGDVPAFDAAKKRQMMGSASSAGGKGEGGGGGGEGEGSGGSDLLPRLLNSAFWNTKEILDPAPKNVRMSDDIFDQGFGLVFKNFIYAFSAGLVVWEIYISFFMERQLPVQSIEQALVGYGNPIDGSKPGDAQNNNNMMPNSNGAPADQSSMGGLFPEINTDPLSQ
jgi:hypothetical protein